MMNGIWCAMIIIGVVYGILTGNVSSLTNGVLDSSKEAVTLCITMLGVMAMWNGFMEIASESGLVQCLSEKISPLLSFLFPNIPKNHKAREEIAMNFIANILGLGWAATPAGLRAMEQLGNIEDERKKTNTEIHKELDKDEKKIIYNKQKGIASDEMCTFLVLNISSLQLIPVNIIAYRSQYGSVNPAAVIGPGILATLCSTMAAVVFCKVMSRKRYI